MDTQISVIIPVYNIEAYLERCLDSVLSQTFSAFEVILVDDGSTDGSAKICQRYVQLDSRFRILIRPNGGLSAARNTGISDARAPYVICIDGDDSIAPRMLAVLHDLIVRHQADMVSSGINNIYGDKTVPQSSCLEEFVCSGEEALRLTLEGERIPGSICCKLFKRELFSKVSFPVGLTYEDAYTLMDLTPFLAVVAVTTEPLYQYYHRRGSITTNHFSATAFDVISVYRYVYDRVMALYPRLQPQARFRALWAHFVVLDRMLAQPGYRQLEGFSEVVDELRGSITEIVACPFFQPTRKLAARVLGFSVGLYRVLMRLQERRQWGRA